MPTKAVLGAAAVNPRSALKPGEMVKAEDADQQNHEIHADDRHGEEGHQRQIGKKLGAAGADHADEERQRQRVGHHHLVEGGHLLLLEVVTARRDIAEQNGDDGWKQRS